MSLASQTSRLDLFFSSCSPRESSVQRRRIYLRYDPHATCSHAWTHTSSIGPAKPIISGRSALTSSSILSVESASSCLFRPTITLPHLTTETHTLSLSHIHILRLPSTKSRFQANQELQAMSQYNRQGGSGYQYDEYGGHNSQYTEQPSHADYSSETYHSEQQGYAQQQSYNNYDSPQPEYQSAPIKPQRYVKAPPFVR